MNPVGTALLALTEANFDVVLRRSPVAFIAFVSPTTSTHYPSFLPAVQELADRYSGTGIQVGQVESSAHSTELADRFSVDAFPTLLWMDARERYPYYASEASPEVYRGERSFQALAGFVAKRTGVEPREGAGGGGAGVGEGEARPGESSASEDAPAASAAPGSVPAHLLAEHDCTALAASYRACMRHRRDRPQRCGEERHEYLVCMSGRWAVPPERHQEMAELYGREFARS
jgi:hypothetical protein